MTDPRPLHRLPALFRSLAVAVCLLPVAVVAQDTAAPSSEERRYGYIEKLEGRATFTEPDSDEAVETQEQSPLLESDRLDVSTGARLEAVLADSSRLHVDGDSRIDFVSFAWSADSDSTANLLRLERGRVRFGRTDSTATGTTAIETPSATVHFDDEAVALVEVALDGATVVTVREGYVEIVTEHGSSIVRSAEAATVGGDGNVLLSSASTPDSFESWTDGRESDRLAESVPSTDLPPELGTPELRYEASQLTEHGAWVDVEGSRAWRPHVPVSWQPYYKGRWSYTPTGLYWVSSEPWGWLPYHYGGWDHHASHGWLWYPGNVYATAWVQWYWGPSHVGWVPRRYYHRHPHAFAHRYGDHGRRPYGYGHQGYGYARWSSYNRWIFCPTRSFGSRDQHRSHHGPSEFRDRRGGFVPRGLVAEDSGGLRRATWRDSGQVQRTFRRRAVDRSRFEDGLYGATDRRRGGVNLRGGSATARDRRTVGDRSRSPSERGTATSGSDDRSRRTVSRRLPEGTLAEPDGIAVDDRVRRWPHRRTDTDDDDSRSPDTGRRRAPVGRSPVIPPDASSRELSDRLPRSRTTPGRPPVYRTPVPRDAPRPPSETRPPSTPGSPERTGSRATPTRPPSGESASQPDDRRSVRPRTSTRPTPRSSPTSTRRPTSTPRPTYTPGSTRRSTPTTRAPSAPASRPTSRSTVRPPSRPSSSYRPSTTPRSRPSSGSRPTTRSRAATGTRSSPASSAGSGSSRSTARSSKSSGRSSGSASRTPPRSSRGRPRN